MEFLRSVVGKMAVARPKIDLQTSFTTAARAAGLISNTQTFDAFANDTNFLLAAYIFEDVGVTAYHGASPVLVNKTYLDAAAGILAVEAYHAGLIRTVLFAEGKSNETQLISNLRQALGPVRSQFGTGKDSGVGTIAAPNIVIAFDRTTRDVLNIVYGAPRYQLKDRSQVETWLISALRGCYSHVIISAAAQVSVTMTEHLAARSRLGCEPWASETGQFRSARLGRTDMLNA